MPDARIWLNAIGIFAATTVVIVFFELSPLWYSAALLAWIVRWQMHYQARNRSSQKPQGGADEGAGLLLAAPRAVSRGDGAGGDPDAG